MVTGDQIRMARHGLRWTVQNLAAKSKVSVSTIKRMEVEVGVPATSAKHLMAVQTVLESAGIEFIGSPSDGPGIRIHRPDHSGSA